MKPRIYVSPAYRWGVRMWVCGVPGALDLRLGTTPELAYEAWSKYAKR